MPSSEFNRCLKNVLIHEGGRVNNPRDPGGKTAFGVTQNVYNMWNTSKGRKPKDVFLITMPEVGEIYHKRYWSVMGGDKLPPGVSYVVFDGAVNSGVVQSLKWMQRALGQRYTGKIDGQAGMLTFDAIRSHPDQDRLVSMICNRRRSFLMALSTYNVFGRGWNRRVDEVERTGRAWASNGPTPPTAYIAEAQAKANVEDAKPLPVMAVADMTSAGGGATGVISQGIEQAKEQLSMFWYSEFVSWILFGLTAVGALLFVGGLLYRRWAAKKAAKLTDALDLEPPAVVAEVLATDA